MDGEPMKTLIVGENITKNKFLDAVLIGPYDLSASLGIAGELDNIILIEAVHKVEKICKESNFPIGYHVIKPNFQEVKSKIKNGYSFIGFSLDFYFLGDKIRHEMELLHESK